MLAEVVAVDRQLREAQTQAEAEVKQVRERLELAQTQFQRTGSLLAKGSATREEFDRYQAQVQSLEAELTQVLNIDDADAWTVTIDRVLAAAIEQVKADVGLWDDDEYGDEPDERLAQAALRMAEMIAQRPEATSDELRGDPTYMRLLKGHRRVFGIA